jgi:hypothetical protein
MTMTESPEAMAAFLVAFNVSIERTDASQEP